MIESAVKESGIDKDADWNKRIDLVLSSGEQLLVLEFMRPRVTVDKDHLGALKSTCYQYGIS